MAFDFNPTLAYIRGEGERKGEEEITVDVNGGSIGLIGIDSRLRRIIESRFKGLLGRGRADEEFECAYVERDYFLAKPDRGSELYRLESAGEEGIHTFWSYGFAGYRDPVGGGGRFLLTRQEDDLLQLSIENFFRLVCSLIAVGNGGFLFHAAGIVKEGKGYVFFGPSRAGKSTVARLSKEYAILSDDLVILRVEKGKVTAAGTPFKGELMTVPMEESYPVEAMFRLVQSREDRAMRLEPAMGLVEVICSIPYFEERPDREPLLGLVERVLKKVPVAKLYFTKSDAFWKVVERFPRRTN